MTTIRWDARCESGYEWKSVNFGLMLSSDHAVLSVCYIDCVLIFRAWRDREEWMNFICSGDGRGETKNQTDERRGANSLWETMKWGNCMCRSIHHSQYSMYDWVLIRQVRLLIRGIWYPHRKVIPLCSYIFWILHIILISIPQSLFPVCNSTILREHKVMFYLLYVSDSIRNKHCVQHTPSTAYTQYCIHPVQHIPSTAYTECNIHGEQHLPKIFYLPLIFTMMG